MNPVKQQEGSRRLVVDRSEVTWNADGTYQLLPGAIGVYENWSSPSHLPDSRKWAEAAELYDKGHLAAGGKDFWCTLPIEDQLFFYGLYVNGVFVPYMEGTLFPKIQKNVDGWISGLQTDRRVNLSEVIAELNRAVKGS